MQCNRYKTMGKTEKAISRIKFFLKQKTKKQLAASYCLEQFPISMVFVYML